MSIEALDWAFKNASCPSSSAKLVLLVYANFANERGWAYPSTQTVARLSSLNPKTARAAIDALERAHLLIDTGKRTGLTGQVKVYQLGLESLPKPDALRQEAANDAAQPAGVGRTAHVSERGPKTDALSVDRKAPVFTGKGSQNRDAEPLTGTTTPEDASASSAPKGAGRDRGCRISEAWKPPRIHDLPPQARAVAEQWPAGAYEAEAEAHLNFWLGEGRAGARKRDWDRAWCNRIVQLGAKPLRDAKAGLKYSPSGGAGPVLSGDEKAAYFDRTADSYDRIGRHDDAAEARRHAAAARGSR